MRAVDPIIIWPANAQLAPIIAEMHRLNPDLNLLRLATDFMPAYQRQLRRGDTGELYIETVGPSTSEYLVYDGNTTDVFTIAMPEPVDDEFMSGLTEQNREGPPVKTDLGRFQTGPWRIERTADGDLLIRPRAWSACRAADSFNFAWQGMFEGNQRGMIDQIGRFVNRWGIFRERHELWEVETAYLPEWFAVRHDDHGNFVRDPRRPHGNQGFWRSTPVGTVSYIDRYDLPIEEHFARAQAIVVAGCEFAIVGDVERGELRVFRASGVETRTEKFRMPEMPWFEVPIGRVKEEGVW